MPLKIVAVPQALHLPTGDDNQKRQKHYYRNHSASQRFTRKRRRIASAAACIQTACLWLYLLSNVPMVKSGANHPWCHAPTTRLLHRRDRLFRSQGFGTLFGIRRKSRAGRPSYKLMSLRGGGSSEEEDDDEGSADRDDGTDSARDPEKRTSNPIKAFLSSLFESNDGDAATGATSSPTQPQSAPWEQGSDVEGFESSSNTLSAPQHNTGGRGGALVQPKAPRNRLQQWLGGGGGTGSGSGPPLDIERVVPLSDRLIPNDDNEERDAASSGSSSSPTSTLAPLRSSSTSAPLANRDLESAPSTRRVWWVNTWADHLPDDEDEDVDPDKARFQADSKPVDETGSNTTDDGTIDLDDSDELVTSDPVDDEDDEDEDSDVSMELDDADSSVSEKTISDDAASVEAAPASISDSADNGTLISEVSDDDDEASADGALSSTNATSRVNTAPVSPYVSSGMWLAIDKVLTLGYSTAHPEWRASSHLRTLRKFAADVTGLHGVLSGKPRPVHDTDNIRDSNESPQMGILRRRLAAIDRARRNIERASTVATNLTANRRLLFWKLWDADESEREFPFFPRRHSSKTNLAERERRRRVKEIDKQMVEAQKQLSQLACEKDVLQRSLNPLWNYTTSAVQEGAANETEASTNSSHDFSATTRQFNFPPPDLVLEYLDMLFSSGRLTRLNHTDLWRNGDAEEYDHEDEWLSPMQREEERKRRNGNGDSGSWLLRNTLGSKLGETTETAAYKAVCAALMSVLAKSISTLHGVNVMTYSDIRLSTEQAPALPTIAAGIIPGSGQNRNYAHEAFQDVMRRGAARKRRTYDRRESFVQREAVVETLLSQSQIAAPLLKLFPLAWQRALLSNIVIMATAIISDFCEGIEFQILGHRLTFAFTPITEDDMIRGMVRDSFNNPRRTHPELFEAAVRATAESVGENLNFLDRWHERALGSDLLRTQIATLIARLVLTLTDDALCGSRLDLWAAHAGGPRLLAALEYRTDRPAYPVDR